MGVLKVVADPQVIRPIQGGIPQHPFSLRAGLIFKIRMIEFIIIVLLRNSAPAPEDKPLSIRGESRLAGIPQDKDTSVRLAGFAASQTSLNINDVDLVGI